MIFILGQITGIACQQAVVNAAKRAALGLPPPTRPPPKTPEQIRQERRDDRLASFIFALWFPIGAIIFCAPPILFVYCVIKFAFALQGESFP